MTSTKFKIVTLEEEAKQDAKAVIQEENESDISYLDSLHPEVLKSLNLNKKISKNNFTSAYEYQDKVTFSCHSGISLHFSALLDKKVS